MKLFELFATLSLETQDFEQDVEKAKKKGKELGDNMEKNVSAKAVAMGNAMYAAGKNILQTMINLGKSSIEMAADIQAENAQFASTFGDLATEAKAAFDSVGKDTNILSGRLRSVGMQAFAQFKGSGMDATKALLSMDEYMRLAADAAAYYDISLEDADTRLRSFLRGNVEAGDAIGLFTSALQRDEKGLELYGLKWQKLNEEQRQMVMLDVAKNIYEQSGAMGQAAREGDSYANVIGNFQRAWKETLATFGGPILKEITPAIERFTAFLQANPETVEKIGKVFGDLAGVAVDSLIGGLDWLSENGEKLLGIFENLLATVNNLVSLLSHDYDTNVTVTTTYKQVIEDPVGAIEEAAQVTPQNFRDIVSLFGGEKRPKGGGVGPGFATGLEYVPHNDFVARLHEGEAVLTKAENAERLRGGSNQGLSASDILDAVTDGIREGMKNVAVVMDGRTVGEMTEPFVSAEISRKANARRYG